jgi:radical SAM protein with 4Fe4S-binding SPASM domain
MTLPTRTLPPDRRFQDPGCTPPERTGPVKRPPAGVPHRIVFDPTSRCTLRCRHCPVDASPEAPADDDLPLDRIRSLLLELSLAGVEEILIGGGEPLCHPAITEILREAAASGLRVILRTNGTLVTPETAGQLAGSGIAEIRVAFDGAEQVHDAIRGRGTYQKALAGIRHLVSGCTDPVAELMIHTRTPDKIERFFEDMATAGVRTIRTAPVLPIGRAAQPANRDLLGFRPDRAAMERLLDTGHTYDIAVRIPPEYFPAVGEIPGYRPEAGACRAGIDHGYIAPSGEVRPCISIPAVSFGSIAGRPFQGVWQGEEARRFRRIALSCKETKLCEAACFHSSELQEAPARQEGGVRILHDGGRA